MKTLDDLLHLCRCSLLFCTVTQPNFQTGKGFCGIDHITPFVKNPASVFASTRRVKYISIDDYGTQPFESIADCVVEQNDSVLIIYNAEKKVMALSEYLKTRSEIPVPHLSTNTCRAYRVGIIKKIRIRLKEGERLILRSTQLIEVGADADFPVVLRELVLLELIIQSAGRCNKEDNLKEGRVYLLQLEDQGQPSRQCIAFAQLAQLYYRGNEDRLSDADFYTDYYTSIIRNYSLKGSVTPERERLMFQDVADMYHIVGSNTMTLFIYQYDSESKYLYSEIEDREYLNRKDYRKTAQYCVQVYKWFTKANVSKTSGVSSGIKTWFGAYSKEIGLSNEDEIYYI